QNHLFGVTTTSPANAWAVGDYTTQSGGPQKTLILHCNGKTCKQVASPNPDHFFDGLQAVAALSSNNAWAVGTLSRGSLILHWNATACKQETSPPNPGGLAGVTAPSSTRIWAVGGNLALHRC